MSTDIIERSAASGPQGKPSAGKPSGGKPSAAKSWLKAIELTSRIEADPRHCSPTSSRNTPRGSRTRPA
jgi:hypothetical protein